MTVQTANRAANISFEKVSFAYPRSTNAVFHDLDWEVSEGEFVVVAGDSGSGKSTLLRCLNGLVPHFSGGRFGGSVHIHGFDSRRVGPRVLSTAVGFVFQDPDAQRVAAIVEDELAFGMEQLGVPRLTMRKRIEETLDLLGIADLRDREVETLSGGERQRVAVAAALTLQPKTLVLDEPTSQLDPWGAEDVISALERLNQDLGMTVITSEHRLERVLAAADRLTVLRDSESMLDGEPRDVLPMLSSHMLPPVARLARALEWFPLPLTIKEARAASRESRIDPASPVPSANRPAGPPIVTLEKVRTAYGRRVVLRDLSIEILPGEVVAIVGRNGSGKTTLLRTIMGFHRPERGRIEVGGVDVAHADPSEIAQGAGYLPQRPGAILFNESVRSALAFTLKHHRGRGRDVEALLSELDLTAQAERNPRDLSVGEQERAALAAVLVADPRVLLLDEPTRGMDARRKRALAGFIDRRRAEGVATVLATHDIELVAETATRVIMLGAGEIVADGTPREVLSGSLSYTTQMNKVFGDGFLTVDDVVQGYSTAKRGLTSV